MENAIDFIVPANRGHSISRVLLSFVLSQKIIKPKDFFEKLKDIGHFEKYQKKIVFNSQTINFNQNQLNIRNEGENGFVFECFDVNGKTSDILKIENTHSNQALISFETRNYIGWADFLDRSLKDVEIVFNNIENIYFDTISLNYLDEFVWNNVSDIDVKAFFKTSSTLLNKKFFESKNGTIILINQVPSTNGKLSYSEERTECVFNNAIKRVRVNHVYALKFSDALKFEAETNHLIDEQLEIAHNANKELLEELLTDEVLVKIGVKKLQ